jgi:hypothetical protein
VAFSHCAGSRLPVGRVDFRLIDSGHSNSENAIARGQGAVLRTGLHSSICGSLRLFGSTPACGSKVRLFEPGFISGLKAGASASSRWYEVGDALGLCKFAVDRLYRFRKVL